MHHNLKTHIFLICKLYHPNFWSRMCQIKEFTAGRLIMSQLKSNIYTTEEPLQRKV